MFKNLLFLINISFFTCVYGAVMVRFAEQRDFAQLVRVDRAVAFEFFEPLYAQAYSQYDFGKRPHYYLERELADDEILFKKVLAGAAPDTKILVAVNDVDYIVGFLVISRALITRSLVTSRMWAIRSPAIVHGAIGETEIEFLFVEKDFRHQQVGRYLVEAAVHIFPEAIACNVYPFRFGNDAALKFYEKMGFVRIGLAPARINAYGVNAQELYFHYRRVLST